MIFLQTTIDSANIITEEAIDVAQEVTGNIWGSLLVAMVMPLLILLLFSYLKNTVAVSETEINKYEFLAEMAIDMLSIFVSFIIGRYILISSTPQVLIKAFIAILVMSVCVVALCHMRRIVLKRCGSSNGDLRNANILVFLEYVIDCGCLVLISLFLR